MSDKQTEGWVKVIRETPSLPAQHPRITRAEDKRVDEIWDAIFSCKNKLVQEEVVLEWNGNGKNAAHELRMRIENLIIRQRKPKRVTATPNEKS